MTWTKRKTFELVCPSGNVCTVRRPGPDLALAAGRLQRTLKVNQGNKSVEEVGEEVLASMDDRTEKASLEFSEKVFLACVVSPKVVKKATKEGEIEPGDIPPEDFWHVIGWFNQGCPDIPVETTEGETTVEAVETFPSEQTGSLEPGSNGQVVQTVSLATAGHP